MRLSIFLLLVPTALAMQFSAYVPAEQYKCGTFRQGQAQDKTLGFYYQLIDQLVAAVSNPFPHSELLSRRALTGDVQDLRDSFHIKHLEWVEWQRGWVILAGIPLVLSVIFPILYIFYRCCLCCCCSSKKSKTEGRYDPCKRNLLNLFIAVFVIIDVFAAATIFITGQYAQIGLEELASRLNTCVDDLNLYKRETDMRIRKLLIDDYQTLNRTITDRMGSAGHNIVARVKKHTGAQVIDTLMNISSNAAEVKSVVGGLADELKEVNDNANRFDVEFTRLRKTATTELLACIQNEVDPVKAMCHRAEKLLTSLQGAKLQLNSDLLGDSALEALDSILNADIPKVLKTSNDQFVGVESALQKEIDKKTIGAQNTLKQIGDDLFVVAETISTLIRQVNFDDFYGVITLATDEKQSDARKYMKYSWYATLGITAAFLLIALTFFLGLLYGCCGRRPSYYDDDCCVRSTGGKIFSCGIFLTLLLFSVLAVITSILIFVTGNTSNLVCQTLRDPVGHPDIMSLLERYENIWKSQRKSSNEFTAVLDSRTPADIIRACQRNETFYQMFEFDKKYHLNQLKDFEKEGYAQLEKFLSDSLAELDVHPIKSILSDEAAQKLAQLGSFNVSQIGPDVVEKIKAAIDELDISAKARAFVDQIDSSSGRPRVISSILEQVEEIDARIAKPLRLKLQELHKNMTSLNDKLSDMQIPVDSLLQRLQHAQALLSEGVKEHFQKAAKEELTETMGMVDEYIEHVKYEMNHDVSSCAPIAEIAEGSTAAVCGYMIDPMNGVWVAMLISLLCLIPMTFLATSLVRLYSQLAPYPKYIVEEPGHNMNAFMTDTYDTRMKPGYANYSYTDDYHRTYR